MTAALFVRGMILVATAATAVLLHVPSLRAVCIRRTSDGSEGSR